jgi:hypothetical protein
VSRSVSNRRDAALRAMPPSPSRRYHPYFDSCSSKTGAETVERENGLSSGPCFPRCLPCQTDGPLLRKLSLTDYWGLEDNALTVSPSRSVGLPGWPLSSRPDLAANWQQIDRHNFPKLRQTGTLQPLAPPDPAHPRLRVRTTRGDPARATTAPQSVGRMSCTVGSRLLAIKGAIKFLLFTPYQRSNPLGGRRSGWTRRAEKTGRDRIKTCHLDTVTVLVGPFRSSAAIFIARPPSSPGAQSFCAAAGFTSEPCPSARGWGIGAGGISAAVRITPAPQCG